MAFDADTHTAEDAPASRAALNAAILEVQHLYSTIVQAHLRAGDFARAAIGTPEHDEIERIERELKKLRWGFPMALTGTKTDLQRARDEAASEGSTSILRRHYERGELSTVGD